MSYKINVYKNKSTYNLLQKSQNQLVTIQKLPKFVQYLNGINQTQFYQMEQGQVIDIILDEQHPEYKNQMDIGKIKVKLLQSNDKDNNGDFYYAYPISNTIIEYPIIGQYVVCCNFISFMSTDIVNKQSSNSVKNLYYMNVLSTMNNINQNRLQGLHSIENNASKYKFTNKKINKPKLLYGQKSISGRFNNNIIFGISKQFLPNIKIQNNDKSNIILYSDDCPINNTVSKPKINGIDMKQQLNGQKIYITSNGLLLQSKTNSILMQSKKHISLKCNQVFSIQSKTSNIIVSDKLCLGSDLAKQSAVLGNKLQSILLQIIEKLASHTHVSAAPGSPTTPPVISPMINSIKFKIKNILSKIIFLK